MSNLINKTGLQKFATKLWAKIKDRYDDAFVNAEIPATEKKIKFTKKKGGDTVDVSLEKYARLQDRNEFEQDVSVDDAGYADNSKMGKATSTVDPSQRTIGARNLSSALFTDGFVSKLRVYVEDSVTTNPYIHIWAINKNATKAQDTTNEKLAGGSVPVHGEPGNKYIDIPINKTFTNDVYFILRTSDSSNFKAIDNIPNSFENDVINLVRTTPPSEANRPLTWEGANTTKTGKFELYGRMGIVDLNKKIEKVSADSSLYVLKSETTATGGNGNAGKVAKLGNDGKLSESMLPAIAINDFISVYAATWGEEALNGKEFQNGDTIFHEQTQKRYLCINKDAANFNDRFVELNSKDGVVQSVNGKVGAITLALQATSDKVKLNIGNGTDTTETAIPIISDDEITEILNALPQ